MQIQVPFRSQLGFGSDKFRNDCLIACLSMIRGAYGFPVENPDDIYKRLGIVGDSYLSVSVASIDLQSIGVLTDWKSYTNLDTLKAVLTEGKPVIALVKYTPLVQAGLTESKTFTGMHFVVVVGFDATNIIYHDPYMINGSYIKAPFNVFDAAWLAAGTDPLVTNPSRGILIPRDSIAIFKAKLASQGDGSARWAKVNVDALNIRTAPIVGSVIRSLKLGTQVRIVSVSLNWAKIDFPLVGYCFYPMLTEIPSDVYIPPQPIYTHGRRAIDISYYQEFISWGAVAESGVKIAFIKCTDGVGLFEDSRFQANYDNAKRSGMPRLPYHFHWTETTPEQQFRLLQRTVGGEWGDEFPAMIDLEDYSYSRSTLGINNGAVITKTKTQVQDDLLKFMNLIEADSSSVPLLYTGYTDFMQYISGDKRFDKYPIAFAGYPYYKLSTRNYISEWDLLNYSIQMPLIPETLNMSRVKFWQFTDQGKVYGIKGNVDLNIEIVS